METSSLILNKQDQKAHTGDAQRAGQVSPFFKPFIQKKLTVNQPGDEYEQEADAIADKVMRMPEVSTESSFFKPAIPSVQRKCTHCEEEKKMQRKESNTEAAITPSTESYITSLSGGRSLNESERNFFEPRMGYDFSNVRLYSDNLANNSAQQINALAYTQGNDIVFRSGQYQPDTDSGKKLMAHELTHVIQQSENLQTKQIQRKVVVNPAGQTTYVAGLLSSFCNGVVTPSGNTIVSSCNRSINNSCDCVCDVTSDPARTYTIDVQPQVASPQNTTLWDGTSAMVPMITPWPNTAGGGGNPTITIHSPTGRNTEFGGFDASGATFYYTDWRILAHELCGHGRLGQTYSGGTGNRPAHDTTIDTENTIASEQGSATIRGHFADRRQGESFFNPIGNRTKIGFSQTDGFHFEAP
ncbi:MAG: hypothetical protein JWQ09_3798 [Segetibacter sp.]|nr:hypothetical protein [Segetibacter sp.]